MELKELRNEIDQIDDRLVALFVQRMEVSARIADYKKEHDLPIFVPSREQEKLLDVAQKAGSDMAIYTRVLYDLLFELSRGYQSQRNARRSNLYSRILAAMETTPKMLPRGIPVACPTDGKDSLDVVGRKMFGHCAFLPFKGIRSVLSAVEQGLCAYGIVPIENSRAEIYDLLTQTKLFLVRECRLGNRQYICVSKQLEIFPGGDRTTLCLSLSDRPGSLYKVLARLYTLGINVLRMETGPAREDQFGGMFYFDLETSVYSDEFVLLICELEDLCKDFSYLGSYCEVV